MTDGGLFIYALALADDALVSGIVIGVVGKRKMEEDIARSKLGSI